MQKSASRGGVSGKSRRMWPNAVDGRAGLKEGHDIIYFEIWCKSACLWMYPLAASSQPFTAPQWSCACGERLSEQQPAEIFPQVVFQ